MARKQGKGSFLRRLLSAIAEESWKREPSAERHGPMHSDMPRHEDEPYEVLGPICYAQVAAADDHLDRGDFSGEVLDIGRGVRRVIVREWGHDDMTLGEALVALGAVAVQGLVDYGGVRVPCGLVNRLTESDEAWAHHAHISVIRKPAPSGRVRFRIAAFGAGVACFEVELAPRTGGIPGQIVTHASAVHR